MAAIIGSPTRYIQGKGEMKNLCSYADKFGKNLFILTSASGRKRVEPAINEGNKDSNLTYDVFNGECCMTEINRIIKIVEETGSDVIIGIGGGKIHDTSKAVAYYTKKPVIIVPTIASTDAPCSALSVIYTDEGVFEKYLFLPSSPDMVMVDTDLISCKPKKIFENVKYIVAGGYNMAVITEKNDLYLWGDNTYGQLGNGKKDGWYFGDSDKECWFKPKKVMKDVAAVHMGSGGIIVTRMDGSKWATGIGFGNERSESGKKVSTRFVMISK